MTLIDRLVGGLLARPDVIRVLSSIRALDDATILKVLHRSEFRPIQKPSEILGLVSRIRAKGYSSVLEIGTASGGTSVLVGRAIGARGHLTSVDLVARYKPERLRRCYPRTMTANFVVGDSHDASTAQRIEADWADGFDVVFIDGDHSYSGVRLDTLRFAPLAKPSGMVVFHDIQPALATAEGAAPTVFVGGVPDWWSQIQATTPNCSEALVASTAQSGFGIGVVYLPDSAVEVSELIQGWSTLPTQSG